jgi:propionate catabolism operon transcriptional regulator
MVSDEKKFRFAVVGHSYELANAVQRCVNPETEELITRVVNAGEGVSVAKQLVDEGIEIIFGHMGNAQLMFQEIGQPVVEIPRTHLDMMIAFKKAKAFGSHIGLTSFSEPTDGIDFIEEILDIKIHQIIFENFAEMETGVNEAFNQGVRVLVGGGVSTKIIPALGGRGIVVEPRQRAVEKAFREARVIASFRRKEAENTARLKTILQMIEDGVVCVDNYGRIDIYNENAETILGMNLKRTVGQSQSRILKDTHLLDVLTSGKPKRDVIKKIGPHKIVVNALPIENEGRPKGAVALLKTVSRIESISRKFKESLYSRGFVAKHTLKDLVGETAIMRQLKLRAKQYAQTHTTLIIQGETGTGKELLAQAIHNLSPRRQQPFVAINCAALPESLLESELFGYEEGAFTGAKRGGKIGLFELAHRGTVYLDEIADISAGLQMRLLRVIENKEVMRVGGDRYVPVDVRIISSSYQDLHREMKKGCFRPDLYYRLAVLKLKLPALHERKEDIPLIIEKVLASRAAFNSTFTTKMLAYMNRYHWPGNVRELISFVESYLIQLRTKNHDEQLISMLLEEQMQEASHWEEAPSDDNTEAACDINADEVVAGTLKEMMERVECKLIQDTLRACRFNKKETAKRLGISVNTLWRKLKADDTGD